MPNNPGRPLAPHVQAAIARGQGVGVQPKVAEAAAGRRMAAHVQQAIQRSMQAKPGRPIGAGRPVAAHVQAAIAKGQVQGAVARTAQAKQGPKKGGGLETPIESTKHYRDKQLKKVKYPGKSGYVCVKTKEGSTLCRYFRRYLYETINTLSAPGQTNRKVMNQLLEQIYSTKWKPVNPKNFTKVPSDKV